MANSSLKSAYETVVAAEKQAVLDLEKATKDYLAAIATICDTFPAEAPVTRVKELLNRAQSSAKSMADFDLPSTKQQYGIVDTTPAA